MFVMTAKVDKKKIILILAAAAAVIIGLITLLPGRSGATATAAPSVASNEGRVAFLKDMGWDVAASPVESGQVRIPSESSQVFDRYNALQKSQGYDLTAYAGQAVMRYVYKVNNYPGGADPVYATLLIAKNQVVGGDITDTAAKGMIRGLKNTGQPQETTAPGAE